jgi:hypothetical protein
MKKPPEEGKDGNDDFPFPKLAKDLAKTCRIMAILYEFLQDEETVALLQYLVENIR